MNQEDRNYTVDGWKPRQQAQRHAKRYSDLVKVQKEGTFDDADEVLYSA